MVLIPKKVKHRKWQKGRSRNRKVETRGTNLSFGSFGLQAAGEAWINGRHLEAGRKAVANYLKRSGKLWIRVFPDKPITKKAEGLGMGKGKGAVDHFVFPVRRGRILYELDGVTEVLAKEAFRRAAAKMPMKTKFIKAV